MKEPVILVVPETNTIVKDKNILYSDDILPVENYVNKIMIKGVCGICIYSLERCLNVILESNPDVVFYNVQYSKKKEMVYFYTNKEVNINSYLNRIRYKSIATKTELLERIKNILITEKNKDKDCISLYEVARLLKTKNSEYEKLKEDCDDVFSAFVKEKYSSSNWIFVHDFDYINYELPIEICDFEYPISDKKMIFSKDDGDLYLKNEERNLFDSKSQEILVYLGDEISKLYDKFIEYSEFMEQCIYSIISINQSCFVKISKFGVEISFKISGSNLLKLTSYSYEDEYGYDCNSNNIINSIKGQEDQLFKNIYVEIGDCPKWSRPILYEIRQNQLAEELSIKRFILGKKRIKLERQKLIEEQVRIKEEKRQKRLELRNKVLLFFKK